MTEEPPNSDVDSRSSLSEANTTSEEQISVTRYIGCCGAYCRRCRVLKEGACKGCKLGYDQGNRDITKAKCPMKVCCFKDNNLETCADCMKYPECEQIRAFHSHAGYKYRKYKQSIEFIRKKGYSAFLQFANRWSGAYGKLE